MSLASNFFMKPVAGLSQPLPAQMQFSPAAGRPVFTLENTDTTSGAEVYPSLQLKNNKTGTGVGGALQWLAQNSAAAFLIAGAITSSFSSITAASESSVIAQTVYAIGTPRTVALTGAAASSFGPTVANTFYLGTAALPWTGMYVGDGTANGIVLSGASLFSLGSITNHPTSLLTNNTVRATIANTGQMAVGGSVDALAMLNVSGTHVNSGTAVRAHGATFTTPASATGISSSYYSAPNTTASAYSSSFAHYFVADLAKGAGSTLTSQYGFYVNALTSGATNYGLYLNGIGGTTAWAIYSPTTAQTYLNGAVGIGDSTYPGVAALTISPTMIASLGNGFYVNALATGNAFRVIGATNNASWNGMLITDSSSGNTKFQVGGSGLIFVNTASQTDTALVSIVGRMSFTPSVTHDLFSNVVASTLAINGSIAVANGLSNEVIALRPAVTLAGTGVFTGYSSRATVSASASGTQTFGFYSAPANAGAGLTWGGFFNASGTGSATGALIGVQAYTTAVATTSGATMLNATHSGAATYALLVNAANAGDALGYGVVIDNSNLLGTAAFSYVQRATSTAQLIAYTDSGGTPRFVVDYLGDVTLGGTGRRIRGDFTNATATNRPSFVTTGAASATYVQALPSTSGVISAFVAYGNPDPANASLISLHNDGATFATLYSQNTGSGTLVPLRLVVGTLEALRCEVNGDIRLGLLTGLATNATFGFPYIPMMAGVPTGTPTSRSNFAPIVFNTTAKKLAVWDGVAWLQTAALT